MISIIIPVFNNHEMTEQCVESIRNNTEDYELTIIDNGSTPPVNIDCDLTIRNNKNTGFPVAVNHGILESTGDIICLLNNDTVVTPGWADKLKKRLGEYSIVSCMTNYAAGLQRVITTAYEDNAGLNYAANELAEKHAGITQDVNFVIGFCMMFPRALYDELGEFDESMWPCSGEEIDFCFRARKAGYKIGIAQDIYIHHYGSKTFGDMQNAGLLDYKDVCKECDAHLAKKWGKDFWSIQCKKLGGQ